MKLETEDIGQNPDRALYGRVLGILQDSDKFGAFRDLLASQGIGEIETLEGLAGIARLEEWKEEVAHYFFGDMEGKMLDRYLDAAKERLTVFSIVVESDAANGIAGIAKANGAVQVAHFGNSVITNY